MISNTLLTFMTNSLSVPRIYYFAIFENYVPKALGSIFNIDPPVAKLSFPNYFKLHLSPFRLKMLTWTRLFLAN